ncbi:MAG: hypothetical protein ACYSVY_11835 [Planctomycetota bacterium]
MSRKGFTVEQLVVPCTATIYAAAAMAARTALVNGGRSAGSTGATPYPSGGLARTAVPARGGLGFPGK